MDNNDAMDPLGDTTPLPELSFEDLLDNSKPDSLMHGLDETLEMDDNFNDNENVVDDFAVQKNESLNTPGPKKESAIKILENRKISTATVRSTATTTQHDEKNVAKIMTKMATQSPSTTLVTPSKILINTKPKSMQSPIFKLTNKTDGSADAAGVSGALTTPKTIANAATLTTIDGKPAVKTAEGKILFIQKASGFGQVGNSASQLSNIRLQTTATTPAALSASTAGVLKAASIVNAKPIGSITSQPFGHTIMSIVPKTTTNSIGAANVLTKPITTTTATSALSYSVADSVFTTKSLSTTITTVPALKNTGTKGSITKTTTTANGDDLVTATTTTTAATSAAMTIKTTANETKTSKISPKPMQIQIVRTSDGKLVKLKQTNIVSSDVVVPAMQTAPKTNVMKSTAATNVAAASGKIIIKTPIKNLTTELLTKNLTIKKVPTTTTTTTKTTPVTLTKAATTATSSIRLAKATVNMSPPTTTVTKMLLAGAIKTAPSQLTATHKASGSSTMGKVADAATIETKTQQLKTVTTKPTVAAGALSDKVVSATSANMPKVLSRIIPVSSTAAANTTGSPTATTTMAGKVVVQSTSSAKPTVVSNTQLIKLSPKTGRISNLTPVTNPTAGGGNTTIPKVSNVPPGSKLQAVQLPGKGGIKYVRVLPKGATITNAAASADTTAEKATTKPGIAATLAQSTVSKSTTTTSTVTRTSTTSSTDTGSNKVTTPTKISALATNTILNATLATPTASTSSSGFKILNSAPQKFTLVRSSHGTTKFLLKQSPNKDGPVSVVSMPQKKLIGNNNTNSTVLKSTGVDNTATAAAAASSSGTSGVATLENTRKHKISDMNMEIKRITAANASAATGGNASDAASDKTVGPEPKKPRYVFVPHNQLKYSKVGNQSQVTRAGYTLQRMSTPSAASGNESNDTNSGGVNKTKSSASKQVYSILRTNKGNGTKSYVVCNTTTGQKSITVRRPFSLNETVIGKAKKFVSTSDLLERREKILKHDVVRSQGVPIKFTTKPQFDVLKQATTTISSSTQSQAPSTSSTSSTGATVAASIDNVLSRRKHCNCSKSQCLKLYCDCFANGEFCQDCTCKDCCNNLQYEDERQRAIKSCLDRNPSAFKPKITARQHSDMRLHNKGCNCKRSGCLKNYCECYEAKIPCSSICKCVGCRNMEDRPDVDLDYLDSKALSGLTTEKRKIKTEPTDVDGSTPAAGNNFITDDVIDATIMCMLSQLTECEKQDMQEHDIEKQIMEELGRCLVEIIDFSIRNSDSILLDESKAG